MTAQAFTGPLKPYEKRRKKGIINRLGATALTAIPLGLFPTIVYYKAPLHTYIHPNKFTYDVTGKNIEKFLGESGDLEYFRHQNRTYGQNSLLSNTSLMFLFRGSK